MANITVRHQAPIPAQPVASPAPYYGSAPAEPWRLMQEMLRWEPFSWMHGAADERAFAPDFDVKETRDHYSFRADVPGLEDKDLEISVSGRQLSVSGQRVAEESHADETYYTVERRYGAFTRSFTLPDSADVDAVEAELKDGVLTLRVAKRAEARPRKISIKGIIDKVKSLGGGDKPTA